MAKSQDLDLIAGVKAGALLACPYLGDLIAGIRCYPRPGYGTMGIDAKLRLYFDPDAVAKWGPDLGRGVFLHECYHVVLRHAQICQSLGLDHKLWNIAGDLAINQRLRDESRALPEGALFPEAMGFPAGKLDLEYYGLLASKQSREQPSEAGKGTPSEEAGEGKPMPGCGKSGSCATGQLLPSEDAPDDDGLSETELDILRHKVAEKIVKMAENPKTRGLVPGWLLAEAQEMTKPPKVPWQRLLSKAVKRGVADIAGLVDYSWARPSQHGRVVLPALRKPHVETAVIVDTSGSVSDADLEQALGEIRGVLKASGQRNGVRVITCDAEVHAVKRITSVSAIKCEGRGGTDLRRGFEAAEKLRPTPQLIIVLTDGYTPWPESAPARSRTIVVTTSAAGPDWATTVTVD